MSFRGAYYDRRNESILLRTWDKDGKRIVETHPFKPYIFLESSEKADAMSLYGTPLRKVEFRNTSERADYLSKYNVTRSYENLPPVQQFLINHFGSKNQTEDFRKFSIRYSFLDIEVESIEFPEASIAKYPVTLITVYDSKTKKFYVFSCKEMNIKFNKETDYVSDDDVVLLPFDNEKLMLKSFIMMMRKWDFDVISGWNSDIFDIPYLINRITRLLGFDEAEKLSPYFNIHEREAETKFGVPITKYVLNGLACIDYLDAYKKFNMNIKESYKLDFIAKDEELGIRKLDYGDKSIYEFQTTDWSRFVLYNIIDVVILVRLEEKLQYIALLTELAYNGLCNIEDGLKTVPLVNGVVAVKTREKGMIMPTFVREERTGKNIGAYVASPRRGFVRDLWTIDATSLYPSTMITMNLSPEMKVGRFEELDDKQVIFHQTNGKSLVIEKEKFFSVCKQQNYIITKYMTVFRQDQKGIIPEILENFMAQRKILKGNMLSHKKEKEAAHMSGDTAAYEEHSSRARFYDTKQNAVKVFMNSIYGYMGNKHAPMGDDDIANSITLTCQFLIKNTGQFAYEWACKQSGLSLKYEDVVIYGDTDSVHISPEQVLKKMNIAGIIDDKVNPAIFPIFAEMRSSVNKQIGEWAKSELNCEKSLFDFKAEKICYGGIYNEKKKYSLNVFWDEGVEYVGGEFKYTGLDVVKSTMPAHAKPIAKAITEEMVLKQNKKISDASIISARQEFLGKGMSEIAFVTGVKKVDIWEKTFAETGKLKGCPWHVKAALTYNRILKDMNLEGRYEPIHSGDKIKILYVKSPNKFGVKAVAFKGKYPKEFDSIFEVDTEVMYEKVLHAYFTRIYSCVDWVLRKHNVQLKTDVLSLLSGGAVKEKVEEDDILPIEDTEDLLDGENFEC